MKGWNLRSCFHADFLMLVLACGFDAVFLFDVENDGIKPPLTPMLPIVCKSVIFYLQVYPFERNKL